MQKNEEKLMRRCLRLARRGQPGCSPNPMVGAVVAKNGRIIAETWHKNFGGPHAEIAVLKKARRAGADLSKCTLLINLEPCVHFKNKKTPACTDAIIRSGIKRVIIAMKDPNPRVAGRGILVLKKAGIKVKTGVCDEEARELNKKFIKWIVQKTPFVSLKVASSLDGKIATKTGDSKWITCEAARKFVKKLRNQHDAVLIGKNTAINDNPELKGSTRNPLRIILDSKLECPQNLKIFRGGNTLVITTSSAPKTKIRAFQKNGIKIKILGEKIRVTPLLRYLGKMGISSVLVEGGAEVFGSFIDARALDKVYWFIAPKIIGGISAKTAIGGKGVSKLNKALHIKKPSVHRFGEDFLIES